MELLMIRDLEMMALLSALLVLTMLLIRFTRMQPARVHIRRDESRRDMTRK